MRKQSTRLQAILQEKEIVLPPGHVSVHGGVSRAPYGFDQVIPVTGENIKAAYTVAMEYRSGWEQAASEDPSDPCYAYFLPDFHAVENAYVQYGKAKAYAEREEAIRGMGKAIENLAFAILVK